MKKQISLLLVAVALNLSNGAQAGSFYSTRRAFTPLFRQAGQTVSHRSGLSQSTINAAKQCVIKPTGALTTPAIRTSELLSKAGTMPTRALTTSSTGWNSEQMRSDYGWWKQIKDSSTARWIASLFAGGGAIAGGIYNAKPVLAEEEAKNPHFEELLKSEYGPTPSMVHFNTKRLAEAISKGNVDLAKDAIAKGADITNPKFDDEYTALMHAARYKRPDIVRTLIEAGANVNARDRYRGTALMEATDSASLKELLQAGAKVNARDNSGETALIKAANFYNRELDITNALLQAGADVNARDRYGKTALMYAKDKADVVNALLQAGADIHARDRYGKTALMYAADSSHGIDSLKVLLRAGADVNAYDKNGETALIKAAQSGHIDIVNVLLQAGADINVKGGAFSNHTPLRHAKSHGHTDIVNLLKQAGAKE